jgi:hypothetical protein
LLLAALPNGQISPLGADAYCQERARGALHDGSGLRARAGVRGVGCHLDRFDAWLHGELIVTSRRPWYDGARELLRRGCPSGTLLTMRHAGKDYDCFVPLEIGYLAQWSISDSDRGG